jgi:hypothetical protein
MDRDVVFRMRRQFQNYPGSMMDRDFNSNGEHDLDAGQICVTHLLSY